MLIKIGNCLVDPAEIAAIRAEPADTWDVARFVRLYRRNGEFIAVEATLDEAEAALVDAGYMDAATFDEALEDAPVTLTPGDIRELKELLRDGCNWICRDDNGDTWAFMAKPVKRYGEWLSPSSLADGEFLEGYEFISPDEEEPRSIRDLLRLGR